MDDNLIPSAALHNRTAGISFIHPDHYPAVLQASLGSGVVPYRAGFAVSANRDALGRDPRLLEKMAAHAFGPSERELLVCLLRSNAVGMPFDDEALPLMKAEKFRRTGKLGCEFGADFRLARPERQAQLDRLNDGGNRLRLGRRSRGRHWRSSWRSRW